jgi:hypothetical protein
VLWQSNNGVSRPSAFILTHNTQEICARQHPLMRMLLVTLKMTRGVMTPLAKIAIFSRPPKILHPPSPFNSILERVDHEQGQPYFEPPARHVRRSHARGYRVGCGDRKVPRNTRRNSIMGGERLEGKHEPKQADVSWGYISQPCV